MTPRTVSQVYSYDNANQLTNELSTGNYGNYNASFGYNSRGLLTDETRTTFMPTINSFTYDGMNCRTQKDMNGTITNYTYNGLGRITAANGSPYSYDNNGNLLSKGSEMSK